MYFCSSLLFLPLLKCINLFPFFFLFSIVCFCISYTVRIADPAAKVGIFYSSTEKIKSI